MTITSSVNYVNSLLLGYSWSGTSGSAATINYSTSLSDWNYSSEFLGTTSNIQIINSSQFSAVNTAIQAWSNVANITFNDIGSNSSSAELVIRQADISGSTAGYVLPYTSGDNYARSDVILDSSYVANPTVGSDPYVTVLHELGHALGLDHPHEGSTLPASTDSNDFTVMSYNFGNYTSFSNQAQTPMIYDIAALQFLYGANTSYLGDNTAHDLSNSSGVISTIWDGGGADVFTTGSYTGSVNIDLREGVDNVSIVGSSVTWIAFGADIESAVVGSGNDTLHGNDLANHLYGGSGNDTFYGNENNDFIQGNQGHDFMQGNAGNDTLRGGKDNDTIHGGRDDDLIFGDLNDDYVHGDKGNDIVNGSTENDFVYGGDGNDVVRGGRDNDYVYGDAGNDSVYGDRGDDILHGGSGADQFFFLGNSGNDTIMDFSVADDTIVLSSSIVASSTTALGLVTSSGSNSIITIGVDQIILSGVSSSAFTASDFLIV